MWCDLNKLGDVKIGMIRIFRLILIRTDKNRKGSRRWGSGRGGFSIQQAMPVFFPLLSLFPYCDREAGGHA
jgi:hypothetical protein